MSAEQDAKAAAAAAKELANDPNAKDLKGIQDRVDAATAEFNRQSEADARAARAAALRAELAALEDADANK